MSWCSDAPEDEAISLFAGLLANPDMTLSPYSRLNLSLQESPDRTGVITVPGFVSLQDFVWKGKDRVVIQPVVSRDGIRMLTLDTETSLYTEDRGLQVQYLWSWTMITYHMHTNVSLGRMTY